ncbi:MAG: hypothetical protein ACXWC4_00960 [Telluria sp.]
MRYPAILLTFASALACAVPQASAQDEASTLLRQAVAAQGGEALLRSLRSVQWEAVGYRNMVEQSERPLGPYVTEFDTISEVHDLVRRRFRREVNGAVYPFGPFASGLLVDGEVSARLSGTQVLPGTPQMTQQAHERMALSPERLLLTALDSPDVHRLADQTLQEQTQHVIAFTLDGAPVRLYLNADTLLPTAVDYSGPLARGGFWSFLGDVTQRTYFSFWWLGRGGLHFPLQWNMESNGLPDGMLHIRRLQVNAALPEAGLAIAPEVRSAFDPHARAPTRDDMPLLVPTRPVQELAPGIVFFPGDWNATLVRQDDGVVVLEAPISSGYSRQVLAEAERRFPGLPVKAVVTTSDAWPHLAGIREYVARGISVYALAQNRAILEWVLHMHYASRPDALETAPRAAEYHLVTGRTTLGKGTNRIELAPLRGETSERQMLAYFPAHRLLYGSDAFQSDAKGKFLFPQAVSELLDASAREHLDVTRFFMMHLGPTDWSALPASLEVAGATDLASGRD